MNKKGITLVELMVAMTILAIVSLGTYMTIASSNSLAQVTWEQNTVTFDIDSVVGMVRSRQYDKLFEDIPHGQTVNSLLDVCKSEVLTTDGKKVLGQTHLRNQQVRIFYCTGSDGIRHTAATLPSEVPDILYFEVECSWSEQNGSINTESIVCVRTR